MMKKNLNKSAYPLLIMLAATLWAIDAIFRTTLTNSIPAAAIVFIEHLIGTFILLPLIIKSWKKFRKLSTKDWINLLILTIVSSALGSILFTKAFSYGDFLTPILLQKLQPIFVILLSAFLLKERITYKQIILSVFALIGSYMLNFGTNAPHFIFGAKETVFFLSIGAAACWGFGTVLSKNALKSLSFLEVTSLRYLLAVPVTLFFVFALNQTYDFSHLEIVSFGRFIAIGIVGVVSILIYYKGLKHVKASISTIDELMLPIVSILIAITPLNPNGSPQIPELMNIIGMVLMLGAIILLSFDKKNVE